MGGERKSLWLRLDSSQVAKEPFARGALLPERRGGNPGAHWATFPGEPRFGLSGHRAKDMQNARPRHSGSAKPYLGVVGVFRACDAEPPVFTP